MPRHTRSQKTSLISLPASDHTHRLVVAQLRFILKTVVGIRVGEEEEINGLDMSELGMEAYPEFSKG